MNARTVMPHLPAFIWWWIIMSLPLGIVLGMLFDEDWWP